MSELRRWRESADAPDDVRRVLGAGARTRAMPRAVADRAKKRVAAAALVPVTMLAWKGLAVAALVAAGAAGAHVYTSRKDVPDVELPRPREPVAAPPVTARTAPSGSSAIETPAPPPSPSDAPSASPPPARRAAPEARQSGDSLARELALVGRARTELASDPASALRALDEHARRFPDGKLAIERELLAVDALERLGRPADARARAARLLGRARGTIYEERVRSHLDPR